MTDPAQPDLLAPDADRLLKNLINFFSMCEVLHIWLRQRRPSWLCGKRSHTRVRSKARPRNTPKRRLADKPSARNPNAKNQAVSLNNELRENSMDDHPTISTETGPGSPAPPAPSP